MVHNDSHSKHWSSCLTPGAVFVHKIIPLLSGWNTLIIIIPQIRSDQISHSVVSDSLRSHESQHARPPCPSPTPGVHWESRPSSQWCHPAISSSVVPFSSCPQSLPASESFPMSQFFAWVFRFLVSSQIISLAKWYLIKGKSFHSPKQNVCWNLK